MSYYLLARELFLLARELFLFAGELYPTEVRGIGIGLSLYAGNLELVLIPFVNYLVRHF